ncbi:MAG: histidinol-phosphatase [Planctomycetales bacterium]|nr:histidinol-phosphatase [Planctomycetales bacterium]
MTAASPEIEQRLVAARRFAREAGKLTLQHFRSCDLAVDRKSDNSPVTVADREAEQRLRTLISEQFANDGILGEEFGEQAGTGGFRWILDPIDGTKSFIHGVPLYTTLIGIERDGAGLAGVIYAPATDEMVSAARGGSAIYEVGGSLSRVAHVSQTSSISEACVLTTGLAGFSRERDVDATERFLHLQASARLARTWGDAYGYLLVATGQADVMVDPALHVWDAAAIQPILEAAGGRFTDWQGNATIHGGDGIGTNGRLHNEVLAALGGTSNR